MAPNNGSLSPYNTMASTEQHRFLNFTSIGPTINQWNISVNHAHKIVI
jgi:hypothetical protein